MYDAIALLISADPSLVESVQGVTVDLRDLRLDVLADVDEALHHLEREELALLIVHLRSGDSDEGILKLVRELAAAHRAVPTLVISEADQPKRFFSLLRAGVADCLSRPLDLHFLAMKIDTLTSRARYAINARRPRSQLVQVETISIGDPFLYHPDEMGRTMDDVRTVAPQETTILLTGETGTGKTRIARLIHDLSDRAKEPFLAVHCGTLSANLIESELFGHVRGAFTGADRDRTGKFTEVGRGTLLLDDVDTLPIPSQVKLLRAVEERLYEAVGSNKSLPMRARLITSSNRSLEEEVKAGRFREDLLYRLNVVPFKMPPLRERKYVIGQLAEKFIGEFAARNRRKVYGLASEALEALEQFHWPGNIRQLRNVIERAVALCPGSQIRLDDLPTELIQAAAPPTLQEQAQASAPAAWSTLAETKGEAEIDRITKALERNGDNRMRTAHELGISRVTLYKKLRKYGLTKDLPPQP